MNKLPASTTRMSENPYQPSQVEQGDTGQSIGLRRIVALSVVYITQLINWRFYGFRWHYLLLLIAPLALMVAHCKFLLSWILPDDPNVRWLIFETMTPWFFICLLTTWNLGVILSSRVAEKSSQQSFVNSDGILYASGGFNLKENAANYNRALRFINRLLTGRSPIRWFIRIPCKIRQPEIDFSRRPNPFDDEEEIDLEPDQEYWYAAGRLDPQKEPELVYQHLGFNSDPAVKIHYIDQQQRSMWLVLASPDAGYLQQTLATLPQSFMITLGN